MVKIVALGCPTSTPLPFPVLARLFAAWWARLPQHSRLHRVLLLRRFRQAYAAANRRDFDLLLTGLDPDIEYHSSEVWQIDFDPLYHGHDGYLEVWRDLLESFEDVRLDPEELLAWETAFSSRSN